MQKTRLFIWLNLTFNYIFESQGVCLAAGWLGTWWEFHIHMSQTMVTLEALSDFESGEWKPNGVCVEHRCKC